MGFKKEAVLVDVFEMGKSKNITTKSLDGKAVLENRIFGLRDTMKRNASYKDKRRWLHIKWEETAKLQLEANNLDWLDYVISEKQLECKNLKRSIEFPVKDDYREAIQDGEKLKAYNDYITVVEAEIELLKGMDFKPKKTRKPKAKAIEVETTNETK